MTKLQKARAGRMSWTAFRMMAVSERNLIKRAVLIAAYTQVRWLDDYAWSQMQELLPKTQYARSIAAMATRVELYR